MHNIFELCCEGYDKLLERQFQKPDRTKKKVYICSPFSDPDPDKQRDNMRRARLYMLYANEHMGYLARAPHAYLPTITDERIGEAIQFIMPNQRAVLLLSFFKEYSDMDIARLMKISHKTVAYRKQMAMKKLRILLEGTEDGR